MRVCEIRPVEHGTQDELYKECGFDAAGIAQAVRDQNAKVAASKLATLLR